MDPSFKYGPRGGLLTVKRRVFVSFHHHGDWSYYETFTKTFCDTYDLVYDNSLEREIDSDNPEYVMRRIREEFIAGSSCTVVLVGAQTWGRKYVDWEVYATLDKQHGLIGIVLPTKAQTTPYPDRLFDNIFSGYAPTLGWWELTLTPSKLAATIEAANSRNKGLIRNARARRLRNE